MDTKLLDVFTITKLLILTGVNALYGILVEAGADENVVDIVSIYLVRSSFHLNVCIIAARKISDVLQRQPEAHQNPDSRKQEAGSNLHSSSQG